MQQPVMIQPNPFRDLPFKIKNRIYIMQCMSVSLTDSEFPILMALLYIKRISETIKITDAHLQTMLMFATIVAIKYYDEDGFTYSGHFQHYLPESFTLRMFNDKERFILNLLKFKTHVTEKDVDMSIFDVTTHRIDATSDFIKNPYEYIEVMLNRNIVELT